jgi:NhaA family Na+:H+ antiporter
MRLANEDRRGVAVKRILADTKSKLLRLAESERGSGILTLLCAVIALALANMPFTAETMRRVAEYPIGIPFSNIDLTVSHWIQDGVLTIFFLVVGLELKQELRNGSLSNPKHAAVPMICAVGGMIVPPVLFISTLSLWPRGADGLLVGSASGATGTFSALAQGWAIPTATDIAFSLAVLAIFAKALPRAIRTFLMTLATVDDLLAIIIIAVFFSHVNAWYWFVGIAVCAVVWRWLIRFKRVPWLPIALIGVLTWVMMFEAGIHPTLAGVLAGLLTPARTVHGEKRSRAEHYAKRMLPYSSLIALPAFALFTTGVELGSAGFGQLFSPVVCGVVIALCVGKPLGIICTAWLSTRVLKLSLPQHLRVVDLIPMAVACGIGFTVSMLLTSLSYQDALLITESRIGVLLASVIAAVVSAFMLHAQAKRYDELGAVS